MTIAVALDAAPRPRCRSIYKIRGSGTRRIQLITAQSHFFVPNSGTDVEEWDSGGSCHPMALMVTILVDIEGQGAEGMGVSFPTLYRCKSLATGVLCTKYKVRNYSRGRKPNSTRSHDHRAWKLFCIKI
jgi:hypothetical protein